MLPKLTIKENYQNLLDGISQSFPNRNLCVSFDCSDSLFLVEPYNIFVYRLLKELVTNVYKHSTGEKAWITLTQDNGIIILSVSDNGTVDADVLSSADRLKHRGLVILSGYDLPVYRSEGRKIGAKGFVNKNIEPEKLISILSKIMQGILYFDREIPFIEGLTDSEKQIIQLIAEGQKRKDIASTLYISERTLSNHLQHIFEKLDVTSAVEAVTKAIQLGYIPPIC